jgi:hypothetical protein
MPNYHLFDFEEYYLFYLLLLQIGDEIADAIDYVDVGTLDAFKFIGAFPLLVELGFRAVCSLENASQESRGAPPWRTRSRPSTKGPNV